jgi:hypothetical protein
MSKLIKNLIIGVIIAIVASFVVRGLAKYSAQSAYNIYLQNGQKDYEIVQTQAGSNSLIRNFTHNEPYFTLTLPNGLLLEKALDNNGIVAYKGETDTIMCQVQIMDTYRLMDLSSMGIARRQIDYNMYSKDTIDMAYDGLVESTIGSSPYGYAVNVEHSIQKIDNVIFVYIKYEIPDEDGNMTRKAYNFLVNGYSIAVYGIYFKSDKNAEIEVDNFLKSIKFE